MISLTVEYALRAAVWLASNPDTSHTARSIASATQVPAGYLSKVLNTLVNAGVVTSQRGLGGGFLLAREAKTISVLEVINAVEPIQRIHECPLKLPAHAGRLCPLHRELDNAIATVEKAFAGCTLASLAAPAGDAASLCPATGDGKNKGLPIAHVQPTAGSRNRGKRR